jgi:hypothetical protein
MTGRQDDRKEYDRTKDRQRILDEYMIDSYCKCYDSSLVERLLPIRDRKGGSVSSIPGKINILSIHVHLVDENAGGSEF